MTQIQLSDVASFMVRVRASTKAGAGGIVSSITNFFTPGAPEVTMRKRPRIASQIARG